MGESAESLPSGSRGLGKWTHEQRLYLLELRARGYGYKRALNSVLTLHPKAHPYTFQGIAQYLKSAAAQELLAKAVEELRKESPHKGFAHTGSRIDALNECLVRLLDYLRGIEEESIAKHIKNIVLVNGEIRQTMEQMRREMGQYGLEDITQDSFLAQFLKSWQEQKTRLAAQSSVLEKTLEEASDAEPS